MARKFFPLLWRFNALVIAAAGSLALFLAAYAAYYVARDIFRTAYTAQDIARVEPDAGGKAAGQPAGIDTRLRATNFARITGTSLLWSPLMATQAYDYRFSSKEASSTRNYIFYDTATGESRKLFASDDQIIFNATHLRRTEDAKDAMDAPPLALYLHVVARDANGDGLLSHDTAVVALARPDGSGLVKLDALQGRAIGTRVSDDGTSIVIMLDQNDKIAAAHVDLATFQIIKTDPVAR